MASPEKVDSYSTSSKEEDKFDMKGLASDNAIPGGDLSELTVVDEGEDRTTIFVWILVFCCGFSGLLFGAFTLSSSMKTGSKRGWKYRL